MDELAKRFSKHAETKFNGTCYPGINGKYTEIDSWDDLKKIIDPGFFQYIIWCHNYIAWSLKEASNNPNDYSEDELRVAFTNCLNQLDSDKRVYAERW